MIPYLKKYVLYMYVCRAWVDTCQPRIDLDFLVRNRLSSYFCLININFGVSGRLNIVLYKCYFLFQVVELINQTHLLTKDSQKITNLKQVQELIVNKDATLLDNFFDVSH